MILLMMKVNSHEVENGISRTFIIIECFRDGTTNRHEINRYAKYFTDKFYKRIKRQDFCQRRIFIKPLAWKEVSKEYLKEIRINKKSRLFKTFKGFRLFAVDGSDFNLPDTERLREEFNVKIYNDEKKSSTM